ncbi:MAG: filamentous hemagglutinin N-terminal domain-containing protein [Elainellaceae cyanobacterium]
MNICFPTPQRISRLNDQVAIAILLSSIATTIASSPGDAQIVPDDTLGSEDSIVTEGVEVRGALADLIEGGAIRDTNLFHSFLEFNVNDGQRVYFANPQAIANIFSRVTGSDPSDILGTLGVDGAANLFFLNPNGIIFGPNASLDIQSSFIGTTASEFVFENGDRFRATNPTSPSLLTVSVPVGLQFGANPGEITLQESFLFMQPGTTLALVGGKLTATAAFLDSPGGRIELGSVEEPTQARLIPQDNGWSLDYDDIQSFGDIQLTQETFIRTSGIPSGDIQLRGQNILLSDRSEVFSQPFGDSTGGQIIIGAEQLMLQNSAAISTLALEAGNAGPITIHSDKVTLQNESRIVTNSNAGNAGRLSIQTTGGIDVLGGSTISASTLGTRNGGRIRLTGRNLRVDNESIIDAGATLGTGERLVIRGFEQILLSGESTISTVSSAGESGNIQIVADRLILRGGSQVTSSTSGNGPAGNVVVRASESILIEGMSTGPFVPQSSGIFTSTTGLGNAGNIRLSTAHLAIREGGSIGSDSLFASGSAGTITVLATDNVEVSGRSLPNSILNSQISSDASGAGSSGTIRIITPDLSIRDGAEISTSTISGSQGGDIRILGQFLILEDQSRIQASSAGSGDAGIIQIQLDDDLNIENSDITTQSLASSGGRVIINAKNVVLEGDSDIRTEVNQGTGGGGTITLTADSILLFDDSDIFAFSVDGTGGNINLVTDAFLGENFVPDDTPPDLELLDALDNNDRVDISATGALESGVVFFPDTQFIQNSLANLSDRLIDTETLVENSCVARNDSSGSTFVVTGSGGLPQRPGDAAIASYDTGDVQMISQHQAQWFIERDRLWEAGDPITEPQGVYQLPSGQLILSRKCSDLRSST